MKKITLTLLAILSIGAFAVGGTGHSMNGSGSGYKMIQEIENLTPEQQMEFEKLHTSHRTEMQKSMLDIKEVNLKIQKEMSVDKPNQKNIDKLIDQKTELQSKHQKEMIKFKIEMKEKFDIEMMGGMSGHMR